MPWSDVISRLAGRPAQRAGDGDWRGCWRQEARAAAIAPWFPVCAGIRVFPELDSPALGEFSPSVIGATAPILVWLAEEALARRLRLPGLDRALVAWSAIGHAVLKPAERDLLWLAYPVPVYEEIRGPRGELLAWECEAHCGLHVAERRAVFVAGEDGELSVCLGYPDGRTTPPLSLGLEGRVETAACACGRAGRRILELRNRVEAAPRASVKTAAG